MLILPKVNSLRREPQGQLSSYLSAMSARYAQLESDGVGFVDEQATHAPPERKVPLGTPHGTLDEALFAHLPRSRLVLHLVATDKYQLAFAAGALLSLRSLNLLILARVISASGLATLILQYMAEAVQRMPNPPDLPEGTRMQVPSWVTPRERKWRRLLYTPGRDDVDYLMIHVFARVMEFCDGRQAWQLAQRRVCGFKYWAWCQPWARELAEVLDSECIHHTAHSTRQLWRALTPEAVALQNSSASRQPVLLLNAALHNRSRTACLTTDPTPPTSRSLQLVEYVSLAVNDEDGEEVAERNLHNVAEFVSTSCMPLPRAPPDGVSQLWASSLANIRSGVTVDPYAVEALETYFIKTRSKVRPSVSAQDHKLSFADTGLNEAGVCEKLLLIDGFSGSADFEDMPEAVRLVTYHHLTRFRQSGNADADQLVGYKRKVVCMFDQILCDPEIPDTGAYRQLASRLRQAPRGLCKGDHQLLRSAANLGYVLCAFQYGDRQIDPLPHTQLCQSGPGVEELCRAVYGAKLWQTLMKRARFRAAQGRRRVTQYDTVDKVVYPPAPAELDLPAMNGVPVQRLSQRDQCQAYRDSRWVDSTTTVLVVSDDESDGPEAPHSPSGGGGAITQSELYREQRAKALDAAARAQRLLISGTRGEERVAALYNHLGSLLEASNARLDAEYDREIAPLESLDTASTTSEWEICRSPGDSVALLAFPHDAQFDAETARPFFVHSRVLQWMSQPDAFRPLLRLMTKAVAMNRPLPPPPPDTTASQQALYYARLLGDTTEQQTETETETDTPTDDLRVLVGDERYASLVKRARMAQEEVRMGRAPEYPLCTGRGHPQTVWRKVVL